MPGTILKVACVVSHPFEENTYLLHREGDSECVIIDPGLEPDKIFQALAAENLTPAAILLTHGHADHIAGNADLKARFPDLPILIGAGDAPKLLDPVLNLSAGFGMGLTSPPADQLLAHGEKITLAGIGLEVRDTPGHSSGHVVFIHHAGPKTLVIGGDVLFQGSIGRTDFPDGSFAQLKRAIHEQLFTLPEESLVLPGHGPPTTIGEEKRSNPYVGVPAGYRPN